MIPAYQMFMQQTGMTQPQMNPMTNAQFMNPIQKMQYVMQAMRNPAMLIKQRFPDVPDNIMNDPNQILQYLQQSRGITNQQLQQLQQGWR